MLSNEQLDKMNDTLRQLRDMTQHPGWQFFQSEMLAIQASYERKMRDTEDPGKLALLTAKYLMLKEIAEKPAAMVHGLEVQIGTHQKAQAKSRL